MPNIEFTRIRINAKKEVIDELLNSVVVTEEYIHKMQLRNLNLLPQYVYTPRKIGEVDFNILVPTPTNITNDNSDPNNNWYDWNCENWGTKMFYDNYCERVSDDEIEIFVETAWAPPYKWLFALAEKAKEVGVKYMRGIASYAFPIDYYKFKLNLKSGKLQLRHCRDNDAYNALIVK